MTSGVGQNFTLSPSSLTQGGITGIHCLEEKNQIVGDRHYFEDGKALCYVMIQGIK